jgi:outer membrane immunogenic protein
MRRLLLAATALTVSTSAFAGEPASSTPGAAAFAAPPSYFNWTGCYLGGNVGPGWGNANFSGLGVDAPSGGFNIGSGGVLGGGQIGCNLQFSRNWILGAEGDFGWSSISGTVQEPFFSGKNQHLHSQTDWIASATGRVGYALDNWMFYGKGGVAWARNQYGLNTPEVSFIIFTIPAFNGTGADTAFGATGGGGIEWAFAPGWSARVEFDFYGFGSRNIMLVDPTAGSSALVRVRQDIEAIRFGINYQFWTGGSLFGNY